MDMTDQPKSDDGASQIDKVRSSMLSLIEGGSYYEALQLIKGMSSRLQLKKKFKQAADILTDGIQVMNKQKQDNAALELAKALTDVYQKANFEPSDENVDRLLTIGNDFSSTAVTQCIAFLKQALKWNSAPRLHLALARIYRHGTPTPPTSSYSSTSSSSSSSSSSSASTSTSTSVVDFGLSSAHYLRSGPLASKEHADLVLDQMKFGYEQEQDLFATRVVLQYLCLSDRVSAGSVFSAIEPHLNKAASTSPLSNFTRFLLRVADRDSSAAPLFILLKQKYAPVLARDPIFSSYLDRIGSLYFALPQTSQSNNFMDLFNKS